ncbi:MAG: NYN domain-containing protein, partial [Cyanobacteria bacterium J06636_27]
DRYIDLEAIISTAISTSKLALDMMALVDSYDTAVLVSGDGDLAYAVNSVSYRGVRVEVVSLRSMTSDSLINVSDRYIDLEAIKEDIQKTPRQGYPYRPLPEMSFLEQSPSSGMVDPRLEIQE